MIEHGPAPSPPRSVAAVMSLRRLLPVAALALALVPGAPAGADQAVAEMARQAPVAAYAG